ncbi:MAG TPA: cyclase family protein [Gemmatimonadaceae bacterium]|nr:cyclase family protein [Gemmatimonadaceae bacterium]
MTSFYDISVPVVNGGMTYPGNPEILIAPSSQVARGDSANVSRLEFGSHTGTHVDAPRHFFDDGAPVDAMPLDALIGPAQVVVMADDVRSVTAEHLRPSVRSGVQRVLIRTRNSAFITARQFRSDYTYLAPDGAELLASMGVRLVGVDYLSIEQFHSGHHRTHRTLLERGIVIVEGLDLSRIAAGEYELCCLPLRLEGLDGAPARAVLISR